MHRFLVAAVSCVVLLTAVAQADEVYLRNGDRLTGTLVRLTDGKLVFKADAAGEVTVALADVLTFSTTAAVEVHLKDGTVLNQPVLAADAGAFAIDTATALRPQTFQLADLASINPPAKPAPKWTGSISAGFTATSGNTSTETVNASVSVARRSDKDRMTASADYATGEQKIDREMRTTEDWWRAKAQYDYFFTRKFFAFINGSYEKDAIADLDRRVVVGGGGGYQWIESPRTNFSTTAGLASLYEKFDNDPDSNSELSAQLGYNFDHQLNKSVKFVHDLTYYPALSDFSDYYLTTTAEVRASLTQSMFANFKTIFNYDATPATGRRNTDVKYIFSIGMTF
ncbi:DUF481 domain-containing protein [Anaerobaca lacustris]|uniref:DUF481 domain-containing protein n=1 Tax=Anaerobaca lacustris TaxID=3044600 RepID=A0AAW6TXT2_9BACT|nr:DUF481 domain-containing protein [Sedimentisphaerales bacterium M17dextr]